MKKQNYIDTWIQMWLTLPQIEGVFLRVLQISSKELFLLQDIPAKYIYEIQKYFYDIASGKPQEYSLEVANFFGRDFFVDERVLIPRNDTEILVKQTRDFILLHPEITQWVYVDVGTGSGCIALSVLQEILPLKFHKSYAIDISQEALFVAKKNAEKMSQTEVEILSWDLLGGIFSQTGIDQRLFCITANLPYIKDGDVEHMDASVVKHEPHTALFWGKDTWFELYERLIKQCFQLKHLFGVPDIHLFLEIWFDQYEVSQKLLQDFWLWFEYFQDSARIYRVVHIHGF